MDFMNDVSLDEHEKLEQENAEVDASEELKLRDEERNEVTESKSDKFHRLAAPRVDKAGHAIELIGNLSGSAYEYTPEEVEKMFAYLQQALDDTKAKFTKQSAAKDKFSF